MFLAQLNVVSDSTITNGDKTVCTRMHRVFPKNRIKPSILHITTHLFLHEQGTMHDAVAMSSVHLYSGTHVPHLFCS